MIEWTSAHTSKSIILDAHIRKLSSATSMHAPAHRHICASPACKHCAHHFPCIYIQWYTIEFVRACMRVYTQSHVHTHAHTHAHTRTHTYAHTYARTHTHAHTQSHTYTRTHTHTRKHAHTYTHIHTYTHACTHSHTRAYTNTHTHTHTHTSIYVPKQVDCDVRRFRKVQVLPIFFCNNGSDQ